MLANQIHQVMVTAALDGGSAAMRWYEAGVPAREKADASPVTAADEAAEAIIVEKLSALWPELPVVAEESVAAGRVPGEVPAFFLVDPLDGTKEFLSGNGEFTVNIALIDRRRPVAGVVYAPAISRLFFGAVGFGAHEAALERGEARSWRSISTRAYPDDGLVVVASRSHAGAETDAFLDRLPVKERVSAGSSLKFCLIAAGEADVYPRLGRTMEWDTAAGHAILAAAGGCVTTLDGEELLYGRFAQAHDAPFANPYFIAWGATPQILSR